MLVFSGYVKSRIIALMRRLERGAGRKVRAGDVAFNSGSRRPAIPGLVLGRRPRTRLAPSYSGGVGAPPGGTKASCQELADVAGLGPGGLMRTLCRRSSNRRRVQRRTPLSTKARPDAGRRT